MADASIDNNTLYIMYDQNKITYKIIDSVFKKWGVYNYKIMSGSLAT